MLKQQLQILWCQTQKMKPYTPVLRTAIGDILVRYVLPVISLAIIFGVIALLANMFSHHGLPNFNVSGAPVLKYVGYAFYIVIPACFLLILYYVLKDWNEKVVVTHDAIIRTTLFQKRVIKLSDIKSMKVFRAANATTRYNPFVWLTGAALGISHSIEIMDTNNKRITIGEIQKSKGLKFCEEIEALKATLNPLLK